MKNSELPNVPFLNLEAAYLELKTELDEAYLRTMHSGWYLLGEELSQFEKEFAQYCGTRHAIGVANGLQALELLLKAYEIGEKDEVIVPSNTYIATWLAVSSVGATVVPVEPSIQTYNIEPTLIEASITNKTKAILVVHLYGQPANMKPILSLAKRYQLIVLEDCAQAHGATYQQTKAGAFAHGAAFSFYPGKNLGAFGDGGAITLQDDAIAEKLRMLRNYGSKRKYYNEMRGINSRLDEIQAAFLRVKLKYLNEWNVRRTKIAQFYTEQLAKNTQFILPVVEKNTQPVWHQYVIRTKHRDQLQRDLLECGVQTMIHYPIPPHQQKAYFNMKSCSFPVSEKIHQEVLSLPMGPHLSLEQATQVVRACQQ